MFFFPKTVGRNIKVWYSGDKEVEKNLLEIKEHGGKSVPY